MSRPPLPSNPWSSQSRVPEQPAKADALVDEAIGIGFGTPRFVHRVTEV
jgi:hypothetical protein